jgi:hypothetical protein
MNKQKQDNIKYCLAFASFGSGFLLALVLPALALMALLTLALMALQLWL